MILLVITWRSLSTTTQDGRNNLLLALQRDIFYNNAATFLGPRGPH